MIVTRPVDLTAFHHEEETVIVLVEHLDGLGGHLGN